MSLQEFFNYNINFNTSNSLILGQTTVGSIFSPGSGMLTHTVNTIGNMFMTGGNIGIGTTSPTTVLHVNGSFRTTNTATFSTSSAGASGIVINPTHSGYTNSAIYINATRSANSEFNLIDARTGNGSAQQFLVRGDGNVGIGTSSPNYTLDVTGSGRFTNNLLATFNSNTLGPLITTGGNTGIGTVAPSYTLDVSGSGRFSNNLLATFNSNTIGSIITTGGNVGIGTSSPSYTLDITGTLRGIGSNTTNYLAAHILQNTASINSPAVLALLAPNLPTSGSTNFFTGRSLTNNNSCDIQYVYTSPGSTQNSMQLGFYGQSTYNLTLRANGNVGIGTTSPNSKFEIFDSSNPKIFLNNTTNRGFLSLFTGNLDIGCDVGQTPIRFMPDGSTKVTIQTNGNVGIGTTSPSSPLDVLSSSTGQFPVISRFLAPNTTGASFQSPRIVIGIDAADSISMSYAKFGTTSGNNYIGWGHTNIADGQMVLNRNGNVGIGTTLPGVPLHVGSAAIDSNVRNTVSIFVPYKDIESRWLYLGWGDPNEARISTDTASKPITFSINDVERMRVGANGNIGIGTTSPAHTLHVNGNIVSSNALILYSVTPFAVEAQWTTYTESTMDISANIPTGAKAVLADVFLTNTVSDHVIITLGSEYAGNVKMWTNTRGAQPSTELASSSVTKRVNRYVISGELDNYSSHFGLWYPSQIIYISTDRRIFWSNGGYSSGSGWVYVNIKGYYL